jgi:hypothetical protein
MLRRSFLSWMGTAPIAAAAGPLIGVGNSDGRPLPPNVLRAIDLFTPDNVTPNDRGWVRYPVGDEIEALVIGWGKPNRQPERWVETDHVIVQVYPDMTNRHAEQLLVAAADHHWCVPADYRYDHVLPLQGGMYYLRDSDRRYLRMPRAGDGRTGLYASKKVGVFLAPDGWDWPRN